MEAVAKLTEAGPAGPAFVCQELSRIRTAPLVVVRLMRRMREAIVDRVFDAFAAVAARWLDLRSRIPLAAADFRDRVLDLPWALSRSASNSLERVRGAAAGAAESPIFDFASRPVRLALGLGVCCSLLGLAALAVAVSG